MTDSHLFLMLMNREECIRFGVRIPVIADFVEDAFAFFAFIIVASLRHTPSTTEWGA